MEDGGERLLARLGGISDIRLGTWGKVGWKEEGG